MQRTRPGTRAWIGVLFGIAGAGTALAACPPEAEPTEATPGPAPAAPERAVPVTNVSLQEAKHRVEVERDLRKLRAKYFGPIRNREIRQIGIDKLREYTDAQIYPSLLSIFEREDKDVRTAIIEHLADQKTDEADATIAWGAVYDKQEWFRQTAGKRLRERTQDAGVPNMVKWVVASGLKSPSDTEVASAANLAGQLKLFEAIPMLINAQVTGGGGGGLPPAIADIIIGTQQAFIADLQPVVGDNAVAFDPTLGVVTDGTVLRILGASVVTYRTEVNRALVGLADSGWDGRSTASLGWDNSAWRAWYANEFKPYRAKLEAQAAVAPAAPAAKP